MTSSSVISMEIVLDLGVVIPVSDHQPIGPRIGHFNWSTPDDFSDSFIFIERVKFALFQLKTKYCN